MLVLALEISFRENRKQRFQKPNNRRIFIK